MYNDMGTGASAASRGDIVSVWAERFDAWLETDEGLAYLDEQAAAMCMRTEAERYGERPGLGGRHA